MSTFNGSNCFPLESHNFTVEGFEIYKDSKQQFFIDYFAFGLAWCKVLICVVGILTNMMNIYVLTRPHLVSSINIQFAALEIVNLILYTTFFYEFAMFYNKEYVILFSQTISVISAISYCLNQTCICVSNWLTVSVGIWRFIAITFPFKAAIYCSKHRSKIVVASVLFFSITLWFYYYFSFECLLYVYELTSDDGTVTRENVKLIGNWRSAEDAYFFKLYFPIAVLMSTAVPWMLLGIVSIALIIRLWMARQHRKSVRKDSNHLKNISSVENNAGERRVTLALLAFVLMYFLTYLPDSVISVMYWFYPQTYFQTWFICRLAWNRCGILFCNSLTILFYCIMSERLRHAYARLLCITVTGFKNQKSQSVGSFTTSQTNV